jgi:hypothetical protein
MKHVFKKLIKVVVIDGSTYVSFIWYTKTGWILPQEHKMRWRWSTCTHKLDISNLEKSSFWLVISIFWADSCVFHQKFYLYCYFNSSMRVLKFWHVLRNLATAVNNFKVLITVFITVIQADLKTHIYWCPFLSPLAHGLYSHILCVDYWLMLNVMCNH